MIVAGCDIGARTCKALVMRDGAILGYEIARSRAATVQAATAVMDTLLVRLGLAYNDLNCCVSTGYGRAILPFAHEDISEISCHGRGASFLVPSIRTVLDGGGQDCKALSIDETGTLVDFRMNTKCAAGTGRSLEVMAGSLGVDVSELGPLSRKSTKRLTLQKPCCVLTEIEIRHMVLQGKETADIAAAINDLMARQILHLARDLDEIKERVGFTGGIAKNIGVRHALERGLKTTLIEFPEDPQIIGALGAALFAADLVRDGVFETP